MGKALVIKNVNFSTNKLTTVTLNDPIPCTAISLSDSTKSMSAVGSTFTLTATVTPSNTTDTVTWESDNTDVVTVTSGGVVTQVGVGTATITATCGNKTATCEVTATNVLTFESALTKVAKQRPPTGGGSVRDYGYITNGGANYACLFSTTQTTYKLENSVSSDVPGDKYPILLGQGATSLTADVPSDIRITVWFINSNTMCDYASEYSAASIYAKVISGDANEYDSSVSVGDRTMTVPSGANSAIFSLQKPGSGNSVSAEDIAAITITAS